MQMDFWSGRIIGCMMVFGDDAHLVVALWPEVRERTVQTAGA
jgi:hypothetical protein